jgi:predicted ABC-type ATPase
MRNTDYADQIGKGANVYNWLTEQADYYSERLEFGMGYGSKEDFVGTKDFLSGGNVNWSLTEDMNRIMNSKGKAGERLAQMYSFLPEFKDNPHAKYYNSILSDFLSYTKAVEYNYNPATLEHTGFVDHFISSAMQLFVDERSLQGKLEGGDRIAKDYLSALYDFETGEEKLGITLTEEEKERFEDRTIDLITAGLPEFGLMIGTMFVLKKPVATLGKNLAKLFGGESALVGGFGVVEAEAAGVSAAEVAVSESRTIAWAAETFASGATEIVAGMGSDMVIGGLGGHEMGWQMYAGLGIVNPTTKRLLNKVLSPLMMGEAKNMISLKNAYQKSPMFRATFNNTVSTTGGVAAITGVEMFDAAFLDGSLGISEKEFNEITDWQKLSVLWSQLFICGAYSSRSEYSTGVRNLAVGIGDHILGLPVNSPAAKAAFKRMGIKTRYEKSTVEEIGDAYKKERKRLIDDPKYSEQQGEYGPFIETELTEKLNQLDTDYQTVLADKDLQALKKEIRKQNGNNSTYNQKVRGAQEFVKDYNEQVEATGEFIPTPEQTEFLANCPQTILDLTITGETRTTNAMQESATLKQLKQQAEHNVQQIEQLGFKKDSPNRTVISTRRTFNARNDALNILREIERLESKKENIKNDNKTSNVVKDMLIEGVNKQLEMKQTELGIKMTKNQEYLETRRQEDLKLAEAKQKEMFPEGEFNTFDRTEDYNKAVEDFYIEKYGLERGMEEANKAKETTGFFVDVESGFVFIDLQHARKINNITIGTHEVLHHLTNKQLKDPAVLNRLVEEFKKELSWEELQAVEKKFKKQVRVNEKGEVIETPAEEWFNAFNDAIRDGDILPTKENASMWKKLGLSWVKNIFKTGGAPNAEFKTGKDVYNYIKDYATKNVDGKDITIKTEKTEIPENVIGKKGGEEEVIVDTKTKVEVPEAQLSKTEIKESSKKQAARNKEIINRIEEIKSTKDVELENRIKELEAELPKLKGGEKAKRIKLLDRMKEGLENPADNRELKELKNELSESNKGLLYDWAYGREGKPGAFKEHLATDLEKREFKSALEGFYADIIDKYDPSKGEFGQFVLGKLQGGKGKPGYPYQALGNLLKKANIDITKKTRSLDDPDLNLRTKGGEDISTVMDTKSVEIKSKMKEKAPDFVDQKLEDAIETAVLEIEAGVKPDVTDKNFKSFVQEVLESKLTAPIKDKFGKGKEYDKFMKDFVVVLKETMPTQFFVKLESQIKPKDRKFTTPPKRLTKQADIDKAVRNDQVYVENTAQGVNIYKLKDFSNRDLAEFLLPPLVNPKTGKKSGRKGTIKTSVAKSTAVELGKDMMPSVFTNKTSEAKLAKIMEKIQRDPKASFSKVVEENPGATIDFYKKHKPFVENVNKIIKDQSIRIIADTYGIRDLKEAEKLLNTETKRWEEYFKEKEWKHIKPNERLSEVSKKGELSNREKYTEFANKFTDIFEGKVGSLDNPVLKNIMSAYITSLGFGNLRTSFLGKGSKGVIKQKVLANYMFERSGESNINSKEAYRRFLGREKGVDKKLTSKQKKLIKEIEHAYQPSWSKAGFKGKSLALTENLYLDSSHPHKLSHDQWVEAQRNLLTHPELRNDPQGYEKTMKANEAITKIAYEALFDVYNKAKDKKQALQDIALFMQQQTNAGKGLFKGFIPMETVTKKPETDFIGPTQPLSKLGKVFTHNEHMTDLLSANQKVLDLMQKYKGKPEAFRKALEVELKQFKQGSISKLEQSLKDDPSNEGSGKMSSPDIYFNTFTEGRTMHDQVFLGGKNKGKTVQEVLIEKYGTKALIKKLKAIPEGKRTAEVVELLQKLENDKNFKNVFDYNEIGLSYFSKTRDPKNIKEQFEAMNITSKAKALGRELNKKPKKIRVFDFDDTVAKTKSNVIYTKRNTTGKPSSDLKAIVMAGGPGSGKSSVIKKLGLENQGYKVVNQDISLEWAKKLVGLDAKEAEYDAVQRSVRSELGALARKIADKKLSQYTTEGKGVILDGTGASMKATEAKIKALKDKGYEVSMVYVETSKKTALERNRNRKERSLKDFIVEKTWDSVNANKQAYKDKFGESFFEFDANESTKKLPSEIINKVNSKLNETIRGKISAEEFAKRGDKMEAKGAKWDFSEFNKVVDGEKGPLFDVMKKMKEAAGERDMFILTARSPEAAKAIHKFLKEMGVDIPLENITGLANSSPFAKAEWIIEKASEGYNDFYFADDHAPNVKAVKEVLGQIDVKSKVQQAKFSKTIDKEFNQILEEKSGIESFKEYSRSKGKVVGAKKGKYKFILPPGAEDFTGLIYPTLGKGKKGEAHLKWYNDKLIKPYNRATRDLSADKVQLMNDFKALKKQLKMPKDLREITKSGYTKEQAARVYLWDKMGEKIPNLTKTDLAELLDIVNSDGKLKAFADQILEVTKGDGYSTPGKEWLSGTMTTDLIDVLNVNKRKKYLAEWQENIDVIYSEKNLNKLEAIFGPKYREALENSIQRMKTGKNRTSTGNRASDRLLDYINGAQGTIMFLNMRSAVLQSISAANFINLGFNNPIKAGKAFLNQKQYWKDFISIMNSDYLVGRRQGLKLNISESEISDAAAGSTNKAKAVINYILEKGYAPTKFMDSFAIASGGATWYRNRIKNLMKKEGLSEVEAQKKAFEEFMEISEKSQQSSDPSKISKQQSSDMGRVFLQFVNTPMQYTRIQKRALQDLANKRGDWKSNISKILYYGVVQNLWFNAMQQGLFALGFGDDEINKKEEKKIVDTANGMADSILRGTGFAGMTISVLKNTIIDIYRRSGRQRPQYKDAWVKLLEFSPAVKSKFAKLKSAAWPFDTKAGRKEIKEKGFSLDNPAFESGAKVISAATNIPLDRLFLKYNNIKAMLREDTEVWKDIALFLGWPEYQLEEGGTIEEDKIKEMTIGTKKEEQIKMLLDLGYSKREIAGFKKEENRVKAIISAQNGKKIKPKVLTFEEKLQRKKEREKARKIKNN